MKIEVLGCSGGKANGANLPSFLVDGKLLLDCGSACSVLDLERQLNIKAVFISHAHFDHICDLPFLVDNFSIAGKKVTVYASEHTVNLIRNNVFNNSIWPDFTLIPERSSPVLQLVSVKEGETVKIGDFPVEFFKVFHTEGSMGFMVKKGDKVFAYTSDTYRIGGLWNFLESKRVTSVITECSFPSNRKGLAALSNHLSVPDFLAEYSEKRKIDKIYVFHLKPHYKRDIEKELKNLGVAILKDGDVIEV